MTARRLAVRGCAFTTCSPMRFALPSTSSGEAPERTPFLCQQVPAVGRTYRLYIHALGGSRMQAGASITLWQSI